MHLCYNKIYLHMSGAGNHNYKIFQFTVFEKMYASNNLSVLLKKKKHSLIGIGVILRI